MGNVKPNTVEMEYSVSGNKLTITVNGQSMTFKKT